MLLFVLEHETQRFSFEIGVSFNHDFLEFVKIVDKEDLLDDFPVALIVFGTLASCQELLLVDANVSEEQLHQTVDESGELLMDLLVFSRELFFDTKEKDAVSLDEGLNWGLPSGRLEKGVDCVENPVLKR